MQMFLSADKYTVMAAELNAATVVFYDVTLPDISVPATDDTSLLEQILCIGGWKPAASIKHTIFIRVNSNPLDQRLVTYLPHIYS